MNFIKYLILIYLLSFSLQANDDVSFDSFEDEFVNETKEYSLLTSYNSSMTSFNEFGYIYLFKPIGQGIEYVFPKPIRIGVNNIFYNLKYPIRLVNSILQLKFEKALKETGSFLINSTIGIIGIFDIANEQFQLRTSPEDFGQTLGYWGLPAGPHIVLPLIGASNVRDIISILPDSYLSPISYYDERAYNVVNSNQDSLYLNVIEKENRLSLNYKTYDIMKKDSLDLYYIQKLFYEKHRNNLIKE